MQKSGAIERTMPLPLRVAAYLVGIVIQCFGIVLCVKCGLGISPINSIPYVASDLVPLTLGSLSILFYLVNISIELVLGSRQEYGRILAQLPVSFVFGFIIDLWNGLLPTANNMVAQVLCLAGSVFFTAFGIMIVVRMNIVPDPPTGAIQAIAHALGKEIGSTKVVYDCFCVAFSVLLGLVGMHTLVGFGIATIVSAVCVGRVLALLQGTIGVRIGNRAASN